jgi:hypothetical protein
MADARDGTSGCTLRQASTFSRKASSTRSSTRSVLFVLIGYLVVCTVQHRHAEDT